MGVLGFRCPTSGENVVSSIETRGDVLVQMRKRDLTLWVWCPHCTAGHQIKPTEAIVVDEIPAIRRPALADA